MSINNTFRKQIEDCLVTPFFDSEDFDIKSHTDAKNTLVVTVVFRTVDAFNIQIVKYKDGTINLSRRPGEITATESGISLTGNMEILSEIKKWTRLLEDELKALPEIKAIERHKQEVNERMDEVNKALSSIQDSSFTKEEAEQLIKKVERLEDEFIRKLEEQISDQAKLRTELDKFNKEITFLKSQVEVLSKSNWIKTFALKSFNWGKRNPKAVRALGGMAYDLLPQSFRDSVPQEVIDMVGSDGESTTE
ncbi:hypothetical protein [Paenibacillus sp. 2TAB19]|uniref:hypothetical protein n=1 Tax=Paenibacillus sp. 2TAB19 TaxID=3233003 RepID=UPI003F971298